MRHMTPAECAAAAFGGIRPLARVVGVQPQTVHQWVHPRNADALGHVPAERMAAILSIARKRNLPLTADDLIFGRTQP